MIETPTRRTATPSLALLVLLPALLATPAIGQQRLGVAVRDAINPGLGASPPAVSRGNPAAAWRSFLNLTREGNHGAAAHLLDLSEVPVEQQRLVGTEVAEKLAAVLRAAGARAGAVTTETAAGPLEDGSPSNAVVAVRFERGGIAGEVWLRRTRSEASGEEAWLFTRQTVSSAPFWHRVVVLGEAPRGTLDLNRGLPPPPAAVQRGNPREALAGFLAAAQSGRFAEAAHYLNLNDIDPESQPEAGPRLARRLMLVQLRTGAINTARVSNDPTGVPESGVAENEERIATVDVKRGSVDIVLAREWDSALGHVWTFSSPTVAGIDSVYAEHGYGFVGDLLPSAMFAIQLLGLQLWQWLALLVVAGLGWLVSRLVAHWLLVVFRRLSARTEVAWDDALVHALDGPLGLVLWSFLIALAAPLIGLTPGAQAATLLVWRLLALLGLGWLFFRLVDLLADHLRTAGASSLAVSFAPILRKVGKVLVVMFVALAALDVIGVKVVALLAGFGLGGLAVAFAAQKTIENLFGALAIAGDRPFRVGDFVTIGDVTGTVEDVGLRSTQVRTTERTLVTIPNGAVVSGKIVNFTARDRMLYNPTIGVVYGTSAAQLTFLVDEIKKMLASHPRVWPDVVRCRFKTFGASSLDIEIFCWVATGDFHEFTGIAEELNFAIAAIVEASGSSFAFPSRTVYLASDPGLDADRGKAIAAEVERRRAAGELSLPEPSPELKERLLAARAAHDASAEER